MNKGLITKPDRWGNSGTEWYPADESAKVFRCGLASMEEKASRRHVGGYWGLLS